MQGIADGSKHEKETSIFFGSIFNNLWNILNEDLKEKKHHLEIFTFSETLYTSAETNLNLRFFHFSKTEQGSSAGAT